MRHSLLVELKSLILQATIVATLGALFASQVKSAYVLVLVLMVVAIFAVVLTRSQRVWEFWSSITHFSFRKMEALYYEKLRMAEEVQRSIVTTNEEHFAILMKGVGAWNNWREKNPDVQPDLREADLQGANLRGADLHGANFYADAIIPLISLTPSRWTGD